MWGKKETIPRGGWILVLAALAYLGSCGKIQDILHEDIYVIEGEMRFEETEGGCWVFVDDARGAYQLVGERAGEIEVDGAEAKLRVKERHDLFSFCHLDVVEILEVLWLRKP